MKFLIAGFGSIGRRHFRNLVKLGHRDIIFYRTHQSTIPDEELKGYPIESDLKAALSHHPDAVIVTNPTASHLDVAIPAAEMGCHLLIEKPLSHSLERVDELERIIRRGSAQVLVGFQFRYHPGLLQIRDWIQQAVIGDVYFVRAHWGEYLPDWHPWEDYREGYSAKKDLGGGVLLTLCHPIDYLRWIFGEMDTVSVVLGGQNVLGLEVEELAEASLRFQSGILSELHVNYLQRPPAHFLEIFGSAGTISWNYISGMLKLYRVENQAWETYPLPLTFSRNDLFLTEMRHFIQIVSGNQPPGCSLEDGIEVQKIITAFYKSAKVGKKISVS